MNHAQYRDRAAERRERFGFDLDAGGSQPTAAPTIPLPQEHKGFQLLSRMGWKAGEGLGRASSGQVEPVPMLGNAGRLGIGVEGTRDLVECRGCLCCNALCMIV